MNAINKEKGRTREDLRKKGELLYEAVKNNGKGLTLEECVECVRYRVICETWNGIIVRENNTVATLKSKFPNLSFEKTDGEKDHTYAVDFEIFKDGKLICAIQVKPQSYTWNAPYILKARRANDVKYAAYKSKFGVPVLTVISKGNGVIINTEVFSQISNNAK